MRVLFLGDIVGNPGRNAIKRELKDQIKKNDIEFVIANGENAADEGVGITKKISENLFSSGVDVITTGNHVWDQKETADYINTENRLLRPLNLIKPSPGNGFEVYKSKNGFNIGVLNLMGNVFMKKCENVFDVAKEFLLKKKNEKRLRFFIR